MNKRNGPEFNEVQKPENNDFLVTDEFVVKGPKQTRRMDLVIFINGIPIVIAECKQAGDPHGITKAVYDLQTYQYIQNRFAAIIAE